MRSEESLSTKGSADRAGPQRDPIRQDFGTEVKKEVAPETHPPNISYHHWQYTLNGYHTLQ